MLEKQTKEIDGLEFRYQPLMATEARKILVELINRFGGSIASGLEELGETDLGDDVDGDTEVASMLGKMGKSAGGIIRELTMNLTPEYYEKLCNTLGGQSEVKMVGDNGQEAWPTMDKGTRDLMFGTKLLTEAKWIGFCLGVQYADFFGLAKTVSQQAMALRAMATRKAKSPSGSQTDSTGISSG